jgi:hypothetical protein
MIIFDCHRLSGLQSSIYRFMGVLCA